MPESPYRQELLHGDLIELPPPKRKRNKSAEEFFLRLVAIINEGACQGPPCATLWLSPSRNGLPV